MLDRRDSLKLVGGAMLVPHIAFAPGVFAQGSAASSSLDSYAAMRWGKGFEGQRKADLGNGKYLIQYSQAIILTLHCCAMATIII